MLLYVLSVSSLCFSQVRGNILYGRPGWDHNDEDTHLDQEFHRLIGVPHQSEKHDDVLVNIELGKLYDEGVLKKPNIVNNKEHDLNDDLLDAEFHKRVGVPHRSDHEDNALVDEELKRFVKEGKIKQTDLDLIEAMETFDNLMSTAETISQDVPSKSLSEREIHGIMEEVVENVKKAGEKVIHNKPIAFNLLERTHSILRNVDKVLAEKEVSSSTKSTMKRSVPEMDKKPTMQDMLSKFYINKNSLKLPTTALRSPRQASSAEEVDEKLSRALDAVKSWEETMSRLEANKKMNDPESVKSSFSRNKREVRYTKPTLKTRGYSNDEYSWLLNEFNLTKGEVDSIQILNEEQFALLQSSLNEASHGKEYTMDDLNEVLKSARQLVPVELEAAAQGALQMGYHLGGRARVAADPVVKLVNNNVVPGAKTMWGNAVESIPDDVKDWAGDGRRIAAKRMQAIAEYARPRLTSMGNTMAKFQEQLSASAEETMKELIPSIVPTLQVVVAELQDTLELAREAIPPMVEEVGRNAAPYYNSVRDGMNANLVKPAYEILTNEKIAKPVGEAIDTMRPIGKVAYDNVAGSSRVVYDEVTPVLSNLATSSGDVMREQVLPAVEDARHQAGKIGKTVQSSVRDVLKGTLNTMFDGVPKMIQQVGHEMHDAAKVFRGTYSSALGKMKSREENPGPVQGAGPASVSPPVFRATKAPKRTYVTSTEL